MTYFLLDTSILIEILRGRAPGIRAKFEAQPLEALGISLITYAELLAGVDGSPDPVKSRRGIDALTFLLKVHDLSKDVAEQYAGIWPYLKRKGMHIGPNDLWIAAHALALDATLVTGNVREFRRVPGLRVENWLR